VKIDKYDMALANAAATDKGGSVLTQICIKDGKLVAADGFMLVCRKADIEEGDGFAEQVLVPVKQVKNIKPTAKYPAKMTIKGKKITATYYNKLGVRIDPELQFKAGINDTFPDVAQLFPKGKKYYQYALGIGLLRKFLSCLPKDGILRLGFMESSFSPMEFCVSGKVPKDYDCKRPIYGMIMPMFVNWEGDEWQRANEEETVKEGK